MSKYSAGSKQVIDTVLLIATQRNHPTITPTHMLHGLCLIDTAARKLLVQYLGEETVRDACKMTEPDRLLAPRRPADSTVVYKQPSEELQKLFQALDEETADSGQAISVLHLLLISLTHFLNAEPIFVDEQFKQIGISRRKLERIVESCIQRIDARSKAKK